MHQITTGDQHFINHPFLNTVDNLDADLPIHWNLNGGDWELLWNSVDGSSGSPVETLDLSNSVGDTLWIGALSQGPTPLVTGGNVTQMSPTEIMIEWSDVPLTEVTTDGVTWSYRFENVVTTISVDASPLYGDIEPLLGGDCDVDGSDLAAWVAMGGIDDLSAFAENFGKIDCL